MVRFVTGLDPMSHSSFRSQVLFLAVSRPREFSILLRFSLRGCTRVMGEFW
jgi:hypothetical protein